MNDSPDRDMVVFSEAVEKSYEERAAYLGRACVGDAELRRRVEALLRTHERLGDLYNQDEPLHKNSIRYDT